MTTVGLYAYSPDKGSFTNIAGLVSKNLCGNDNNCKNDLR